MKYAKLLPVIAMATLGINDAKAFEDLNNEFYIPADFEFISETALGYSRNDFKHDGAKEDFKLSEEILFGLGYESALSVKIANRFNSEYVTNEDYNNDFNLEYELGIRKNLRSQGGTILQGGVSYYTFDPRSWYGNNTAKIYEEFGNKRWQKQIKANAKLGFELENGLMPYSTFDLSAKVDSADRDVFYKWFAGIHKMEDVVSYDIGLRYEFESSDDNDEAWFMEGQADYYINDTTSVGLYGEYQFAGSNAPEVDYGYSVGAKFKILF